MASTMNLDRATYSNMRGVVDDVTVSPLNTDGVTEQEEITYQNANWSQYWGYFNAIPELHSAFLMKSIWTCGKGYTCDPGTKVILEHVTGFGKDTFRDVLFNMDLIKNIGGDSFAEIIRDKDSGVLLNLKPLDPGTMKIVVDRKGILKRYEQMSKTGTRGLAATFEPKDILHLSNCRAADQIHGISRIKAMENVIKAMNESFTDLRRIMHHQAKPFIMWKLKTDDSSKIAEIVAKIDKARNLSEDMFIPDDDDAVEYEIVQVSINAAILEWRNSLNNQFYRALGMPLILFGQAGTTESGGKIEYLGHETVFENDQKYLEDQIWNQLYLKINLIPPTSLLESLQQDQAKDQAQGMNIQPADMMAGAGE